MKKTLSGLLALLLLLTLCVGCGGGDGQTDSADEPSKAEDPADENTPVNSIFTDLTDLDMNETVLEVEGNAIPADLYLYWLMNKSYELEYQLNMYKLSYGLYGEMLDEDGHVKWDQSLEGTPLTDIVRQNAENNALSYALLENVAKAHGIVLTEEDRAAVDAALAQQIEQSGGEEAFDQSLYETGLSRDSHARMIASQYLYQHLAELANDPASDLYEAPSGDNAYVDHILLMTKDSNTNEPLSEEEIAAKKAQAEDLLSQLQASDDLETLFTELADTYGEDPGRESGAGYLIDPNTNFVQEFKDAAFALKPGEISGIVESDYGYHILLRKELTGEHLRSLAEDHLYEYLDAQMEAAMAGVVRSEKLDSLDVGTIYPSYIEKLQALHPAEEQEDTSSGEDGSDGGAEADTPDTETDSPDAAPAE